MFTPQQFHQLAAAAWSGPAAIIQISAYTCQLAGGKVATHYSACYTVAGVQFHSSSASATDVCPFAAVQQALDLTAGAGVLSVAAIVAGTAHLAAAAAAFANQPAPQAPATCAPARVAAPRLFSARAQATCPTCRQAPDYFGQCGCAYIPVHASRYFHE